MTSIILSVCGRFTDNSTMLPTTYQPLSDHIPTSGRKVLGVWSVKSFYRPHTEHFPITHRPCYGLHTDHFPITNRPSNRLDTDHLPNCRSHTTTSGPLLASTDLDACGTACKIYPALGARRRIPHHCLDLPGG